MIAPPLPTDIQSERRADLFQHFRVFFEATVLESLLVQQPYKRPPLVRPFHLGGLSLRSSFHRRSRCITDDSVGDHLQHLRSTSSSPQSRSIRFQKRTKYV